MSTIAIHICPGDPAAGRPKPHVAQSVGGTYHAWVDVFGVTVYGDPLDIVAELEAAAKALRRAHVRCVDGHRHEQQAVAASAPRSPGPSPTSCARRHSPPG